RALDREGTDARDRGSAEALAATRHEQQKTDVDEERSPHGDDPRQRVLQPRLANRVLDRRVERRLHLIALSAERVPARLGVVRHRLASARSAARSSRIAESWSMTSSSPSFDSVLPLWMRNAVSTAMVKSWRNSDCQFSIVDWSQGQT